MKMCWEAQHAILECKRNKKRREKMIIIYEQGEIRIFIITLYKKYESVDIYTITIGLVFVLSEEPERRPQGGE